MCVFYDQSCNLEDYVSVVLGFSVSTTLLSEAWDLRVLRIL